MKKLNLILNFKNKTKFKMSSNKRSFNEMSEQKKVVHKRRTKLKLTLENAPLVKSIKDLIELGRSIKFYKNIDMSMLWNIIPYLEKLDEMVGMESLKETIFYQVIYYLQGMHVYNKEYLHTVIYGPPGCGKSTIGEIIANIYKAMNILSENSEFKKAGRDDFVAGYLGQTAIKTKKLLNSCIGHVLFIDEVYSLGPGEKDKDSFAKEVADVLTGFLSEHKNDFCCIVAGYEEEVNKCFFGMNHGLERRFPWIHRIESYKHKDLSRIFVNMVQKQKWSIAFDEKFLTEAISENKRQFLNSAGDVETFLTKCKMMHSKRVFSLSPEHKYILTKEDVNQAFEFLNKIKPKEEYPSIYV